MAMFFLQIFKSVREREGSEPWTSLYKLVKISCFFYWKYYLPILQNKLP